MNVCHCEYMSVKSSIHSLMLAGGVRGNTDRVWVGDTGTYLWIPNITVPILSPSITAFDVLQIPSVNFTAP